MENGTKVQTVLTNEDGEPITVTGRTVGYSPNWLTQNGDEYAVQLDDKSYGMIDHYIPEQTVWASVLDIDVI